MLNDCLASASAVGLLSRSSAHHFSTSARSSLSGTTRLTRPISRACCAEYWRQRYQISRAFFSPTTRARDRKSTRLNSSHLVISYAVFCLKKKKKETAD